MKIDITSMFFNSKIEGQTATPAWGTSIGQSKSKDCRIEEATPGVLELLTGMVYKSDPNKTKFDISRGSDNRDVLLYSVFDKVYINNIQLVDQSFCMFLVRENTASHKGRLIVSYPPYAKFNNVEINQNAIDEMTSKLGCARDGCWFVYDISIRNQDELLFSACVVDKDSPKVYTGTSQQRSQLWADFVDDIVRVDTEYKTHYNNYLTAIKTKPFVLLAGISGTGKSQKVKELAYMSCPKGDEWRNDETNPGNYLMVEVKPNWHDSSELLGYYSNISGKYDLTPFVRFVYKALQNPDYPFFVCLDEMNLAPVEQYFAEYLSVLESRKIVGGKIVSSPLLKKEVFSKCKTVKKVDNDNPTTDYEPVEIPENLYSAEDVDIIKYLCQNGLRLPSNLFVIGTVNMDDTTHQFSRKVIDRAFTIEMNGGELKEIFSDDSKYLLEYRDEPISLSAFQSEFVKVTEALEDTRLVAYADKIKKDVPEYLDKINNVLKNTPFMVSYRVENELVLYIANMIISGDSREADEIIKEGVLAILLQKILPRVQGDSKLLRTNGDKNVFTDLKKLVEDEFNTDGDFADLVVRKLDEMDRKLNNSYFANFF